MNEEQRGSLPQRWIVPSGRDAKSFSGLAAHFYCPFICASRVEEVEDKPCRRRRVGGCAIG